MNEEEEYECNAFGVFLQYIPNGQIDEAFAIIKEREFSVNERHGYYGSLLNLFVYNYHDLFPDDPLIIERLFLTGYAIHETDPVNCIAYGLSFGRLKCVRYLLKRFPYWMDTYARKIFNECWDCDIASLRLVDLGFDLDLIYKHQYIKRFLNNFIHARNIARKGAIVVIGIFSQGGGGRDIARIIARVVWESRALNIEWEDE